METDKQLISDEYLAQQTQAHHNGDTPSYLSIAITNYTPTTNWRDGYKL